MDYFSGKTILLTGASSGIGEAMAHQLAPLGVRLLLVGQDRARLATTAYAVRRAGSEAVELAVDLADLAATRALADEAMASGQGVDVLLNVAGVGYIGPFERQPAAALQRMLRVNVDALTLLTHRLWPHLPRGGGLLNIASTAAFQPVPRFAAYAASKAYVRSLTEALHEEGRPRGLHVTALCPGPTMTRFAERAGAPDLLLFRYAGMAARVVARAGLRGLARNRRVVLPGARNVASAVMGELAPKAVADPLLGVLFTAEGRR